ncbi:MAG TPA: hypothetical protein VHW00_25130 [Thermoanaerobaculia bacterium]|nr:hypothetical protein [Thermoanaerobaculia bacterium]
MPIILPNDLTSAEIRVLQEFRRLNADRLTVDVIKAIKHPAGGGEAPAVGLVSKGYLTADGDGYVVTGRAKELLAIDPKPMVEEAAGSADSTVSDIAADGA